LLDQAVAVARVKAQIVFGTNNNNNITTIHAHHGKFSDITIAQASRSHLIIHSSKIQ
jgi:hypothetical protein